MTERLSSGQGTGQARGKLPVEGSVPTEKSEGTGSQVAEDPRVVRSQELCLRSSSGPILWGSVELLPTLPS